MKKKTFFSLLTFAMLFAISCESPYEPPQKIEPAQPIEMPAALTTRIAQGNEFAFNLFNKILQTTDDKNVFISPLSVDFALGMMLNGANSETREEMKYVLRHSRLTDAQINEYYRIMLDALPAADPLTKLNIANSIW